MLPAFDLNNADFWKITGDERAKHNASFAQQNPVNGFITGNDHLVSLDLSAVVVVVCFHVSSRSLVLLSR